MKLSKSLRVFAILCCLSLSWMPYAHATQRTNIIFDTDMGNDVDDVQALEMLLKYHEAKKINLIAVMGSRDAQSCCEFVDLYNTWYGYPNIPIGMVVNGSNPTPEEKSYAFKTINLKENGKNVYKTTHKDPKGFPNAVDLYRKLLAKAPNKSVVIVAVGFSTNLARLMETTADEYSPLSGMELLKRKVSYISIMAGDFRSNVKPEYNVWNDAKAAQKLYMHSPVPLAFSTFDLGKKIMYPGSSIQKDFEWTKNHPLKIAYSFYKKMPYDRPTWDLTSVLFALEPNSGFFGLSERGNVSVDEKGSTTFTPDAKGNCRYLTVTSEQQERIKNYFIKLVSKQPKRFKK